jgi:DNA-binding transcriptional LysR family regulator
MGSTSALKEAVKAGLGFAFISRRAVEQELNHGLLTQFKPEGLGPVFREIYIVFNQGRTLSPMATKFLRYLKKRREDRA